MRNRQGLSKRARLIHRCVSIAISAVTLTFTLMFIHIGGNPAPRDFPAEHRAASLHLWGLDAEPASDGWDDLQAALSAYDWAASSVFEEDRWREAEVVQLVTDTHANDLDLAEFRALAETAERAGFGDAIDRMGAAPWVMSPTMDDPVSDAAGEAQGARRALVRFLAAESALARDQGDQDSFVQTVRRLLAVARAQNVNATVVSHLAQIAAEASTWAQIHTTLMEGTLDEQHLRELLDLLSGYQPASIVPVLACERAHCLRMLWGFTEPGPVPKTISRSVQIRRAEALFDLAIRGAEATGEQRLAILAELPDPGKPAINTMMADLTAGSFGRVIFVSEKGPLELAGARLHVAIELYRARHGAYPVALADLVPEVLSELPSDPHWPGGIGYCRAEDPTAYDGRGFLLYAVGFDGIDDGGNQAPDDAYQRLLEPPGLPGFDWVFNRMAERDSE